MYTLVIVDDEEYILAQLIDSFNWLELGFRVTASFTCAADTIDYMRTHPIDVLLTDIRLGVESGIDLARAARELRPAIEIVFLSAYGDFEYARDGIRLNVYDYLLKPVTHKSVTDCFSSLKIELDESTGPPTTDQEAKPVGQNFIINKALEYVHVHVGEEITLQDVAEYVALNPAYFGRLFRKHVGEQFKFYLSRVRMEKAIELLSDPANKVYSVCFQIGYRSRSRFYEQFKAYTGKTPLEYRNEVLGGNE